MGDDLHPDSELGQTERALNGVIDPLDLDQLVFHPWVAQAPRNVPAFVGGDQGPGG